MSKHQQKIEELLALLINEETDAAVELFHQVIVEKSRTINEELDADVNEELEENEDTNLEEDEELDEDNEELDEDFGGDPKAEFANQIDSDKDEIDAEEAYEGDDDQDDSEEDMDYDDSGDMDPHEEEHADTEDRLEDLEAAMAELTAEFEELIGGDVDLDGDLDGDYDDEEVGMGMDEPEMDMEIPADESIYEQDDDSEQIDEATKLDDKVGDPGMGSEGQESGDGDSVPVNDKSVHSTSPRKDYGGKPTDFAGDKAEDGFKAPGAKDEACEDNIDVDGEAAPKAEEKPVHDDKSAKSTLDGTVKK